MSKQKQKNTQHIQNSIKKPTISFEDFLTMQKEKIHSVFGVSCRKPKKVREGLTFEEFEEGWNARDGIQRMHYFSHTMQAHSSEVTPAYIKIISAFGVEAAKLISDNTEKQNKFASEMCAGCDIIENGEALSAPELFKKLYALSLQ